MRISSNWVDYSILDTFNGIKVEKWGDYVLSRPDPQVIWDINKDVDNYNKEIHANYIRSKTGGGYWDFFKKIPNNWEIKYKELKFMIKPTGFKHMGLFPEQAVNWDYIINKIPKLNNRDISVINLFAYTGGATLAAAYAGARVCHVDASKGVVDWAKHNAIISGLNNRRIRWIVDDCEKFVNREIRRGNKYDVIIMDPPSYGRGPTGQIWKFESKIHDFINLVVQLLSDNPLFLMFNSYTSNYNCGIIEYLLNLTVVKKHGGKVLVDELGLPIAIHDCALPCGSTAIWTPNIN